MNFMPPSVRIRLGLLVFACLALANPASPAAAAGSDTRVHYRVAESAAASAPRRVLVVTPEIDVFELSAGGVTQKVPDLTREARQRFDEALREALSARADLVAVPMPSLSPDEQDDLDDLIATFDVVAGDAFRNSAPGLAGWEDRAARFDYTLGYGLPALKARHGADAALLVFGVDYQSTGGRKALAVLGALTGVIVPTGYAQVRWGLVDLASGDILWLHIEGTGTGKLTDAEATKGIVEKTLATLPALAAKR